MLLGLRRGVSAGEVGVALGVGTAYFFLLVRMASPEERSHVIEYGVLALLIHEALLERARQGRKVLFPALLAIAAASLIGILDEAVQAIVPNRVFDPRDILFNVLACVMAVGVEPRPRLGSSEVGIERSVMTWALRVGTVTAEGQEPPCRSLRSAQQRATKT